MSLFYCIDLLENRLKKINGGPSILAKIQHLFSQTAKETYLETSRAEKELLTQLLNHFYSRIIADHYADLEHERTLITAYRTRHPSTSQLKYLTNIYNDLLEITRLSNPLLTFSIEIENDPRYQKYQTAEYKIAKINQSTDFRLGLSKGECHGFTYAMVDPGLSPYNANNAITSVPHQQKIHYYQKNQLNKELEVKNIRHTRRHFCPNPQKQVEEIFSIANQHQGKEFCLVLQQRKRAHATYISVQSNGYIRYMDPNLGAYRFKQKNDFFDFYNIIYKRGGNFHYKFYQLHQISYDPTQSLTEPKTLMGKVRSFMTGIKYPTLKDKLLAATIAGLIRCAATCALSALLGYFGLLLSCVIVALDVAATFSGYQGILGIPHFIKECWYDYITEGTASDNSTTQLSAVERHQKSFCSTGSILRHTSPNNLFEKTGAENIEHHSGTSYTPLFSPTNILPTSGMTPAGSKDMYCERLNYCNQ